MIGVSSLLGDHSVLGFGNDAGRKAHKRPCEMSRVGDRSPGAGPITAARSCGCFSPTWKRKDLAAAGVQGQPQPLLIGLFAHKAAKFVRFRLQGTGKERIAALRRLNVKMGGRRLVALD